MDDSGVADALYTVMSVAIVVIMAIAVSSVVLSNASAEGGRAASSIKDTGSLEQGASVWYYSVDPALSWYTDPDGIFLNSLESDATSDFISQGPVTSTGEGAVLWCGSLSLPSDVSSTMSLECYGSSWLWIDGKQVLGCSGSPSTANQSVSLSKGIHSIKVKYYYPEATRASCSLAWGNAGNMSLVGPLYH
jgi:hypothetical protein